MRPFTSFRVTKGSFCSEIKLDYPIYFWSSHDRVEVDFIFETHKGYVAIECKTAYRWENRYQRGLQRIREELGKSKVRCFGVYLGSRSAVFDSIQVIPIMEFCKKLWNSEMV